MGRAAPYVGMPVRIVLLGRNDPATVEAVRDEGRTIIVDGRAYTLRRLTGQYVAEGEPYYGARLVMHE